ncbi:hypothetical protein DFP72DRAFT_844947 [Ephemerocybe angulata]|uniref:Uncharacterized protein n=1 Tax=Ephemerocybe angulata TaxID=980116 RepID=A0A8H6I748_9AGAR|nr:hypothetical protein DFP72DRAFT_844947 [Tulosesus angulatus]
MKRYRTQGWLRVGSGSNMKISRVILLRVPRRTHAHQVKFLLDNVHCDLFPSLFYALWTSRSWDVPISVFRSDFNSTEEYWFDALTPSFAARSKPGKQCDPHVFDVRDSLVTNSSLFDWKVDAVLKANAGESGFSYKGDTLDNCDVNQITLLVDLTAWSIEGEMVMNCGSLNDGGGTEDLVELAGVARFGVSVLSVKQTNFQRMAKSGAQDFRMFKI